MWHREERRLEDEISKALARPVRVMVAGGPGPAACLELSPGERARYRMLVPGTARPWLAGRAALKRLLAEVGRDTDTSALVFPHRRFSLTHAGDLAVAVAVEQSRAVGVDLEGGRVDPTAARFFLRPREVDWLRARPAAHQPAHAQRLWTVKEAVFKADAGNHGRLLVDYEVADPRAWRGAARRPRRGGRDERAPWRYVTTETPWGTCTVAVQAEATAGAAAEEATC